MRCRCKLPSSTTFLDNKFLYSMLDSLKIVRLDLRFIFSLSNCRLGSSERLSFVFFVDLLFEIGYLSIDPVTFYSPLFSSMN